MEANVSTHAHDYERRTPKELQQRKRGRPPRPMDKQSVPTPRQGKQHYRRPPQHEEGQQPGPKEHSAGRDNEDWMFSRERFHQLKKEHGLFTLDAAASADGSNAQCRDFCSAGDHSFLKRELRGETIWANFPYGQAGEFLQHYVEQKANDPSNGGMFVLPQWKGAAWWPIVEKMELVKTYVAGEQLFTAPVEKKGGARRQLGPTSWPVCIFWDPPTEDARPVQPNEDP